MCVCVLRKITAATRKGFSVCIVVLSTEQRIGTHLGCITLGRISVHLQVVVRDRVYSYGCQYDVQVLVTSIAFAV